jgi:DNA-binding NarL/FixJ family response regulator
MRSEQRVAIVSEHGLCRQGIAEMLRKSGFSVIEAATPTALGERQPWIALVDLDHTQRDGATLLRQVQQLIADAYVIAVGTPLRISAAVNGFTNAELEAPTADSRSLTQAVSQRPAAASPELARLHRLWAGVTPRQRDVLRWLSRGLDNSSIALRLKIGERAVKAHVTTLLEHFQVANRTQLALMAERAGVRPTNGR